MSKIIEGNEKIKRIQIENSMSLGVGFDESVDTSIEKPTAAAGTLFNLWICDFLNLNEWMMFLFFLSNTDTQSVWYLSNWK